MSGAKLRIAGLVSDSIVDGAGLRLSVFVQGCPHRCPGCHNPESHDPVGGSEMAVAEIAQKAARNPLLSGITLTGGEPMEQAAGCLALVRALPEYLNVWVYSGYTYEEILGSGDQDKVALLNACDVLVDGRFVLAERSLSLRFRGSRNQRVIDLNCTRAAGEVVWLEGYDG
ncbi:MAG: anaerobic ribonucleoside-triphosphate reductase activating protein [Oscillospiraceae bacterium]|jgi:anaerobic ribonucleoside-triphosphate reductase activating protein|nr:anaerobic ribonucleoside-triphosphate reductase activating protein [Oscillospiraceae bacterium]